MSSEATDPADRLAQIKRRVYLAQPGPWCHRVDESDSTDDSFSHCVKTADGITVVPRFRSGASDPDLEFIAHARDDVPWLIAEVERLRARCEVIPILLGEIELLRAAALTDGTEAGNG